jgi:UDP-glucose 4-epimerase
LGSELNRCRKVLITGGSGTLGYNVLNRLACDPRFQVVATVRNLGWHGTQQFADHVAFIENDLADAVHTAQIIERVNPEVIVHCAASGLRPPRASWFELMQFNVVSTMRLFQMNCRLDKASHFIYLSTGLAYREQRKPLSENDPLESLHPYGACKAAADLMLQAAAAEFNRRLTILRPFAFTGIHDGGGRLFPLVLESASQGKHLNLTAGTQVRDFCAVNDIAAAVVRVIESEQDSLIEKFNLGGGISLPLREVLLNVCEQLQLNVDMVFGASRMHPFEPTYSVADISHAREKLGWSPETNLAFAVWELAQQITPSLKLRKPERYRDGA